MKQTQLFTKTQREVDSSEKSRNAQLLEQAGFVYKNFAGVYSYLPLGFRVLKKITQIIREEMNAIGGEELVLAALQDPGVWKATDRWDDEKVDVWFKTKLHNGSDLGLATTHEDPLTELMTHYISSYNDLPVYVYQFQTKFRNELRAKSGLMRVREFLMKDLYSFNRDEKEFAEFYEKAKQAYLRIFERFGLGEVTYYTFASGQPFTDGFSNEFQTLSEAGEDTIYLHEGKKLAVNKEVYTDEVLADLGLNKDELVERKAIEVGNIFPLGTKYAKALGLYYTDRDGNKKPVVMGSYGIGPGRVMGTIVEVSNDEKGIIWPRSVAPFQVHLVGLFGDDDNARTEAGKLYSKLTEAGIEVLYDDRAESPGVKFADSDLIGIPYRVIVSAKTIQQGKYELKIRSGDRVEMVDFKQLIELWQLGA